MKIWNHSAKYFFYNLNLSWKILREDHFLFRKLQTYTWGHSTGRRQILTHALTPVIIIWKYKIFPHFSHLLSLLSKKLTGYQCGCFINKNHILCQRLVFYNKMTWLVGYHIFRGFNIFTFTRKDKISASMENMLNPNTLGLIFLGWKFIKLIWHWTQKSKRWLTVWPAASPDMNTTVTALTSL